LWQVIHLKAEGRDYRPFSSRVAAEVYAEASKERSRKKLEILLKQKP
jgi:hypothetical protein